jgi:hypothetical protein
MVLLSLYTNSDILILAGPWMGWIHRIHRKGYLPREVLLNFLNVSLAYGDIRGGVAPVVIDDRDFGDGARYKDKEGVEDIENDVVIDMDLAVLQELGGDVFEAV